MYGTDLRSVETAPTRRSSGVHRQQPVDAVHAAWDGPRGSDGKHHTLLTALPLLAADLIAVLFCFGVTWQAAAVIWPAPQVDWLTLGVSWALGACVTNAIFGLYPGVALCRIAEA